MVEFVMPLDITGEEKLIGGVVSLRQVSYVFVSIILIGFFCTLPVTVVIKVVFGLICLCMAFAFGFVKVDQLPNLNQGISLDKFIILWWKFRREQKIYTLEAG